MPNRQNHTTVTIHLSRHKATEFGLTPVFLKKRWAKDNNSKPGFAKPIVDRGEKVVAHLHCKFVEPYTVTAVNQKLRERFDYRLFVFRRMANEKVPTHFNTNLIVLAVMLRA